MVDANTVRNFLMGTGGEQVDDYTNWKNQKVQNADMNEVRRMHPIQTKMYSFLPIELQNSLLRQNNYDEILKRQVDKGWEEERRKLKPKGQLTGGAAPVDYSSLNVPDNRLSYFNEGYDNLKLRFGLQTPEQQIEQNNQEIKDALIMDRLQGEGFRPAPQWYYNMLHNQRMQEIDQREQRNKSLREGRTV